MLAAGDLDDRLRQSLSSGTGGDVAEFAQCNRQALRYFYDGHHTPELVPDWLAWQRYALDGRDLHGNESLSLDQAKRVTARAERLREHARKFKEESLRAFAEFHKGKITQAERFAVSTRAAVESEQLARETLEELDSDRALAERLKEVLRSQKARLVVASYDFARLRPFSECR
jgi:hypothetical protein